MPSTWKYITAKYFALQVQSTALTALHKVVSMLTHTCLSGLLGFVFEKSREPIPCTLLTRDSD